MAKMEKMEYESDAAKDKMGKTGLKDPGHLQVAANYATSAEMAQSLIFVLQWGQ